MSHRVLDVTAYTTFDYLQGGASGLDWDEDGIVVLNVESDEEEGVVRLSTELDPTDVQRLDQHADHVELFPDQARTLASTLREAADRVEEEVDDE
ncbi:hypothetical protein GRX03_08155 [Halovenus sp. WSH3]|uniref:Uncharacterized protein n=1 Tax=Halovenus carboxidivorans TaxID=2692199 RepID=A0A6B0T0Z4_9EURY|nr:DUF6360 family protein [Halovenus carboxidivorans]MXR51575.1 hypothetical protein [Halovenus carboxidivorans]